MNSIAFTPSSQSFASPATHESDRAQVGITGEPNLSVLVGGGGINGAGTFRDLALQGVDCLIVEKGDRCSGSSAAPSRLIHGGLKYLETGEFRLVAESARERNLLLRNAPHLGKPLPTVVPIHSAFGGIAPAISRFFGRKAKLADRGLLVVELGMALYDWLGRHHRTMPRHGRRHTGVVRCLRGLVQPPLHGRERAVSDTTCSHSATIKASFGAWQRRRIGERRNNHAGIEFRFG